VKLQLDLHQLVVQTAGALEPSPVWVIGLPAVNPRSVAQPELHLYSYMSECECPYDCLRDHENE
jgi:hypothetical protein